MEHIDTLVIGAGAAGLAMGHHLQRAGRDFLIVDGGGRVGDCWRERYDSLRLFSRPKYSSLPGRRIGTRHVPSRDEMADYLESYAQELGLPVRCGVRVTSVMQGDDGFLVTTSEGDLTARNVIVATGAHRRAVVPSIAADVDPAIRQLTSLEYRNPSQFAPGGVLVVGAANSGTDIALDAAAAGHPTYLAGRHPGQIPVDIDGIRGTIMVPFLMFAFRNVLTLKTPMGRKAHAQSRGHGLKQIRNKLADLEAAGINQIGRVEELRDGRPVTVEGVTPPVNTIVWCTGSIADHRFLEVPT
ncbi:MAG: flavin-containing monooxygenase, partial [Marmoricola sp.]